MPVARKPATISNYQFLCALLYIIENGCKWRALPTKLHLCCTLGRYAFAFHLSAGNRHDAPEGRKLIGGICSGERHPLLMDRAYEDEKTRALAAFHQRKTGGSHGIMTGNFINAATRWNAIF